MRECYSSTLESKYGLKDGSGKTQMLYGSHIAGLAAEYKAEVVLMFEIVERNSPLA